MSCLYLTIFCLTIPALTLINSGTCVSGRFPLNQSQPRAVLYRLDGTDITSYIVYDDDGRAIKRVDLTGKAHAGIPTPHVLEYKRNINSKGQVFVQASKIVRPTRLEEIP